MNSCERIEQSEETVNWKLLGSQNNIQEISSKAKEPQTSMRSMEAEGCAHLYCNPTKGRGTNPGRLPQLFEE